MVYKIDEQALQNYMKLRWEKTCPICMKRFLPITSRHIYCSDNCNKVLQKRKRQLNKKHINTYARNLRKNNINYRILSNLRHRIWGALKMNIKSQSTMQLLGCTIKHFKQHLKLKFLEEMSWTNYGKDGWEIDHIRPCSSFDLSKESEQRKCFHYTNLQPLWATDNRKKYNEY